MKRPVLLLAQLLLLLICTQAVNAQTSYTWNGSTSTNWNTATNWTPNGIPGTTDNITIVTGSNTCLLNANATIANIKLTSGTLDLGGFTLTAGGTTATFTTGTIQNGTINVTGATTTSFGAGPVTMNCIVTINSAAVTFRNTTFQQALTITKTGATNDASAGNNIFNGVTTINNAGSGYLLLGNGNPDQFNAPVTFNNIGTSNSYVAYSSTGNVFNAVATFNNAPTANVLIYVGQNSPGTQFNDNIVVTSTNGQGIQFGGGATATSTLAAGKTISVGSGGFSAGILSLRQFTQTGATAQNLSLTGTAGLTLISSTFGGDLTTSSPALIMNTSTFNGATDLTKTGSTGDWGQGGNVFNGVCSITNSGSSYLVMGNANPDIWNNDVTFTDNGSERLLPCWASAGNQFNGNIYVNTSGSATGIQFCGGNAIATATLAATKTIQAGSGGLTAGYLYLKQFTQLGSFPINIVGTGTTALYLGPNSNFGGTFTATAPDIWAQGATYNSPAAFIKTGGGNNHNQQNQNIFNSTCTIDQQSNTGYFMLGYNSNDLFADNIIVTASGKGGIYLGWTSGTGTPTLAAGKTILVGSSGFSAGFLYLNTFTQLGNAPVNLNFTGTNTGLYFARSSVIGGDLTSNSPDVYFSGCTFNGIVNATKTGAANDYGYGGNTFQSDATLNNTGSGYLILGNVAPDTWNGDAIFSNSGSSYITPGWNAAGNTFNGNIIVSSTGSSGGVYFCQNNAASATQAAGGNIQIGAAGFSSGALSLKRFTQLGNVAINLTLTGATTLMQVGPASAIGGDFTVVSPRILLNGAVYSGVVNVTKTGATGEWSSGGNTFNNTTTINQKGAGYFGFANGSPDIYNSDVYVNNNSTERVIFGNTPTGNQFNGNIILTQTGSSVGTAFGWSANTDITLAAGKTISIGAAGYTTGYLQIERFTQLGNTPVNLPLTGNSSLTFGPTSIIGGDLTSTSGSLLFNGCTFNGIANCTKTGTTNDAGTGNNIFNGVATMTNAGSGYLLFGNGNRDQFMTNATFNNTGSSNIYVAYNSANNVFGGVTTFNNTPTANAMIYVSEYSPGTVFSDNIVVSSTAGQGVQFCNNASGSVTLSAGKTISVGAGGFSAGTLLLARFTQTGATAQNLPLTGTGNLTFGPTSAFGGDVTSTSGALFFNGCNFGGMVTSIKTGATNDGSIGNNTFNGAFTVTNTGTGYFLMGNGNPDTWQSTATFNNQSAGQHMYMAYASTGNTFNGDVFFNNQPGAAGLWIYSNNAGVNTQFNGNISVVNVNGGGVYFGSGGGGNATLASGKAISVGAAGFNAGALIFRNFTQTGSTPQNITTTGTSYIQYGINSSFDGPLTSSSPGLFFTTSTFNGTVNATKTGSSNDQSPGNNTFNGAATFTNNGTGYLLMSMNYSDAYNGNVSFVQNSSGLVYPNYNYNCNYAGSISVTSPAATAITFGSGVGTATLMGSSAQYINATGSTPTPVFTRLVIANTGGDITLNTASINVSKTLTMTSGLLNTTTSRILTMLNGSTTSSGSALSTSFVNGPMRYQKSTSGVSTLNFPIGNTADCRPVVLTINHSNGTLYTYQAQLFNASAAALGYTLPLTVDKVSSVHYYTIGRTDASGTNQPTAGLSGNQTIQIYFGANDIVTNGSNLTVVKNTYTATTSWIDIGGAGGPVYNAGANLSGSITSTSFPSAFNSFSTFALGDKLGGGNVLPVELLFFHATPGNDGVDLSWATATELNNSYFTIERSRDAANFEPIQRVDTKAFNGNSNSRLDYTAVDANPYTGTSYYRLRQTDINGQSTYSNIVSVNLGGQQQQRIAVYPNPSSGTVYVSGLPTSQSIARAEWYDAGGRLVLQESVPASNGLATLHPNFNNGIYLLKLVSADGNIKLQNVIFMR